MGGVESRCEHAMPPLSAVPPVGVLPAFTAHQQPVRLEFGKTRSAMSDVVDLATARPRFVVQKRWTKMQVCTAAHQPAVLLNVYSRGSSKWNVKGDSASGRKGGKDKPDLFDVKYKRLRGSSRFRVRFTAHGRQVEWSFEEDKARRSILLLNERGVILAHAGRQLQKSFAGSSRFVVTIAPGVDLAMVVGLCVCMIDYESQQGSAAAASAGAAAASASAGGAACSGGGGGGGC